MCRNLRFGETDPEYRLNQSVWACSLLYRRYLVATFMDRKQPSEKDAQLNETASSNSDVQDRPDLRWQWAKKLTGWGVESRGETTDIWAK